MTDPNIPRHDDEQEKELSFEEQDRIHHERDLRYTDHHAREEDGVPEAWKQRFRESLIRNDEVVGDEEKDDWDEDWLGGLSKVVKPKEKPENY